MPTWPWAVVEITAGESRERSAELIRAAYRASRSGVVAVALRGVSSHAADRLLDDIVDPTDPTVQGILYVDADDAIRLTGMLAHARCAIGSSAPFRAIAHGLPVRAFDAHHAELGLGLRVAHP